MARRTYQKSDLALIEKWLELNDDSQSEIIVKELGDLLKQDLELLI